MIKNQKKSVFTSSKSLKISKIRGVGTSKVIFFNFPLYLTNEIRWFTDGSKFSKGTGAGAFCAKAGVCLTEGLGQTPTVLQVELYAIEICSREMMYKNPPRRKSIQIFTGSEAAVRARSSGHFVSRRS